MPPAIKPSGNTLRIFPKCNGVELLHRFFLVVVRNVVRHKPADFQGFFPGGQAGFGNPVKIQLCVLFEIPADFFGTGRSDQIQRFIWKRLSRIWCTVFKFLNHFIRVDRHSDSSANTRNILSIIPTFAGTKTQNIESINQFSR